MDINTQDIEITSFEPVDKEPFHYYAAVRSNNSPAWFFTYTYPPTDKQALLNNLAQYWSNYDEARIMKVRLPLA